MKKVMKKVMRGALMQESSDSYFRDNLMISIPIVSLTSVFAKSNYDKSSINQGSIKVRQP
jgi:hypothetical protein